jgi:hypothetical protein
LTVTARPIQGQPGGGAGDVVRDQAVVGVGLLLSVDGLDAGDIVGEQARVGREIEGGMTAG